MHLAFGGIRCVVIAIATISLYLDMNMFMAMLARQTSVVPIANLRRAAIAIALRSGKCIGGPTIMRNPFMSRRRYTTSHSSLQASVSFFCSIFVDKDLPFAREGRSHMSTYDPGSDR